MMVDLKEDEQRRVEIFRWDPPYIEKLAARPRAKPSQALSPARPGFAHAATSTDVKDAQMLEVSLRICRLVNEHKETASRLRRVADDIEKYWGENPFDVPPTPIYVRTRRAFRR